MSENVVEKRKTGKWVLHEDLRVVACSVCDFGYSADSADESLRYTHKYCPNCGSLMGEE